jgi:DNA-binding MarR family transcriptional regulator
MAPEQKPNCICMLRNIHKAIGECEQQLINRFGLNLNEAMTLCTLCNQSLCASEIAEAAGMQCPQTSKVIKSLEKKGFLERQFGESDKRNMFFVLTNPGKEIQQQITHFELCIPEILKKLI